MSPFDFFGPLNTHASKMRISLPRRACNVILLRMLREYGPEV